MSDAPDASSVHACPVLVAAHALLIRALRVYGLGSAAARGRSGRAFALPSPAAVPLPRLVADDRVHLEARHGRLVARRPEALAGLIEVRGLGIRRVPHEPAAVIGYVV